MCCWTLRYVRRTLDDFAALSSNTARTNQRRLNNMQRAFSFLGALAVVASCAKAINVGTCEQFAAVDRKTETEVTITTADFACDEYTRLSIRTDMVLKSSVGKVTFSNLALKVYGSLTAEPDVVFTGITLVVSEGLWRNKPRRTFFDHNQKTAGTKSLSMNTSSINSRNRSKYCCYSAVGARGLGVVCCVIEPPTAKTLLLCARPLHYYYYCSTAVGLHTPTCTLPCVGT